MHFISYVVEDFDVYLKEDFDYTDSEVADLEYKIVEIDFSNSNIHYKYTVARKTTISGLFSFLGGMFTISKIIFGLMVGGY